MDTPEPSAVPVSIPIVVAAVSAIPVIISRIVAWALGRSGVTMRELMEAETEHQRTFLRQPSKSIVTTGELLAPSTQSRFDRFFLVGPAASARQRIFKGLFYFFFGFAVLSLLTPLLLVSDATINTRELIPTMLFGSAFYFILALMCRRVAKQARG